MTMAVQKTRFYFEVSFAPKGEKARWVRSSGPDGTPNKHESFIECQAEAMKNGERPYRINKEPVPGTAPSIYG